MNDTNRYDEIMPRSVFELAVPGHSLQTYEEFVANEKKIIDEEIAFEKANLIEANNFNKIISELKKENMKLKEEIEELNSRQNEEYIELTDVPLDQRNDIFF